MGSSTETETKTLHGPKPVIVTPTLNIIHLNPKSRPLTPQTLRKKPESHISSHTHEVANVILPNHPRSLGKKWGSKSPFAPFDVFTSVFPETVREKLKNLKREQRLTSSARHVAQMEGGEPEQWDEEDEEEIEAEITLTPRQAKDVLEQHRMEWIVTILPTYLLEPAVEGQPPVLLRGVADALNESIDAILKPLISTSFQRPAGGYTDCMVAPVFRKDQWMKKANREVIEFRVHLSDRIAHRAVETLLDLGILYAPLGTQEEMIAIQIRTASLPGHLISFIASAPIWASAKLIKEAMLSKARDRTRVFITAITLLREVVNNKGMRTNRYIVLVEQNETIPPGLGQNLFKTFVAVIRVPMMGSGEYRWLRVSFKNKDMSCGLCSEQGHHSSQCQRSFEIRKTIIDLADRRKALMLSFMCLCRRRFNSIYLLSTHQNTLLCAKLQAALGEWKTRTEADRNDESSMIPVETPETDAKFRRGNSPHTKSTKKKSPRKSQFLRPRGKIQAKTAKPLDSMYRPTSHSPLTTQPTNYVYRITLQAKGTETRSSTCRKYSSQGPWRSHQVRSTPCITGTSSESRTLILKTTALIFLKTKVVHHGSSISAEIVNIHTSRSSPVFTRLAPPRLLTEKGSNRRATSQRGFRMGRPCDRTSPYPPRGPLRGRKATHAGRTQLQARGAEGRGDWKLTTTGQARASPPSNCSLPEREHCSSGRGNRMAYVAQQNEQGGRKVAQSEVRQKIAWIKC
jgi:hypothetical protein